MSAPDFFRTHGWLVLCGLAIFPRITLLVSSFVTGGILWWVGWLFAPHFLVAVLLTRYWHANPVLVVLAWLWAFIATSGEGAAASYTVPGARRC